MLKVRALMHELVPPVQSLVGTLTDSGPAPEEAPTLWAHHFSPRKLMKIIRQHDYKKRFMDLGAHSTVDGRASPVTRVGAQSTCVDA